MLSVVPNIVFAPNMTQNAERKQRTQDANTAHFRTQRIFTKQKWIMCRDGFYKKTILHFAFHLNILGYPGLPQHRENREFCLLIFPDWENTVNLPKTI